MLGLGARREISGNHILHSSAHARANAIECAPLYAGSDRGFSQSKSAQAMRNTPQKVPWLRVQTGTLKISTQFTARQWARLAQYIRVQLL